jgi:hypothetical protein
VDCIYLNEDECRAQPYVAKRIGRPEDMTFYKPNEEDQKEYRKDKVNFKACPRFKAYQDDLRARGLEKKRGMASDAD